MKYVLLAHLIKRGGDICIDFAQVCYLSDETTEIIEKMHSNSIHFIVSVHDLSDDSSTTALSIFLLEAQNLGVFYDAIDLVKKHGTKKQRKAVKIVAKTLK